MLPKLYSFILAENYMVMIVDTIGIQFDLLNGDVFFLYFKE